MITAEDGKRYKRTMYESDRQTDGQTNRQTDRQTNDRVQQNVSSGKAVAKSIQSLKNDREIMKFDKIRNTSCSAAEILTVINW